MALVALPSQLSPVDSNLSSVILLIGLAVGVDYSLFYLRREREERAGGRRRARGARGRGRDLGPRRPDLRPDGDRRDGRDVPHRRQDLHLVRRGHDPRRRDRDVRLAHRAAGGARLARRPGREGTDPVPRRGAAAPASRASGRAIVDRVMRRPWLSIALAGGALVALAIPALNMKIVVTGPDDLPQDLRGDQDLQPRQGRVPRGGRHGRRRRQGQRRPHRRRRSRRSRSCSGAPRARTRSSARDRGHLQQGQHGRPDLDPDRSATATTTSRRRRSTRSATTIIPATVGRIDGRHRQRQRQRRRSRRTSATCSTSRLPLIFAFVFALAFLLLLFTFRSIVIPIKAILLNLLSVGAAYGVLVLVFQDGLRRVAARLQLERRRHLVAAAVPVRAPVRALDGLPRVHPLAGPRGLRRAG